MSQTHGVSLWSEPTNNGGAPGITSMALSLVGDRYLFVEGATPDAVPIDRGDGVYVITAVTDPLYSPTDPPLQFSRVRNRIQSVAQFPTSGSGGSGSSGTGTSSGSGPATTLTFKQFGIGARTRTYTDKMRERVSVMDFEGVDNTGATDSTAGIAVAFAVMDVLGAGILRFPRGRYGMSAELEVPANVILEGDGMGATEIFPFTTTRFRSFFYANAVSRTRVRDMTLDLGQPILATYNDYPTMYNVGFYGFRSSDMYFDRVEYKNLYTASVQFFQCSGVAKFHQVMFRSPAQSQNTVINHIMVNTCGLLRMSIDDCDVENDEPTSAAFGVAWVYASGQSGPLASLDITNSRTNFCGRSKAGTHNLEVITCYGDNRAVNITNSVFNNCLTQVIRINCTWKATVRNLKATMAQKAVAGENMISIAGTWVYFPGLVGAQNITLEDLDLEDVYATDRIGISMISYDWSIPIKDVSIRGVRGNGLKYATRISGPHNGITLEDYKLRGSNGNIIRIEAENSAGQVEAQHGVSAAQGFMGNVTMRGLLAEHGPNGAVPVQFDFTTAGTAYPGEIGEYTIDTMTQRALAGSVAQAVTWRGTTDHQTGILNIRHATLDGYAHALDLAHGKELFLEDVKSRNTSSTPILIADFGAVRRRGTTYSSGPSRGRVTLVAGVAIVNTTEVVTLDEIRLDRVVRSGTTGELYYDTIVPGVSFAIRSENPLDTSTILWEMAR